MNFKSFLPELTLLSRLSIIFLSEDNNRIYTAVRDYYKLLGVNKNSTQSEIKKAFRKKAKEFHPDMHCSQNMSADLAHDLSLDTGSHPLTDNSASDEAMKLLLSAYKVLSNEKKRREYDGIYNLFFYEEKHKFSYRDFLKSQKEDLGCQSRLILYDLLHSHKEEAISLYMTLLARYPHFNLSHYLSWSDYMDCLFLLAEQFEFSGEYDKAFELFKLVYVNELKRPYFKHFIEEVIFRLRRLVCTNMSRSVSPETNIQYIEELLNFGFSTKDNAILYKKLAEIYLGMGKIKDAIEALHKALANDKNVEGIMNLQKKINIPEIQMSI